MEAVASSTKFSEEGGAGVAPGATAVSPNTSNEDNSGLRDHPSMGGDLDGVANHSLEEADVGANKSATYSLLVGSAVSSTGPGPRPTEAASLNKSGIAKNGSVAESELPKGSSKAGGNCTPYTISLSGAATL